MKPLARAAVATALAAAALLLRPSAIAAQEEEPPADAVVPPEAYTGPGMVLALGAQPLRPAPRLRATIGRPTGLAGHIVIPMVAGGWAGGAVGLRIDGFYVLHEHDERSPTVAFDRKFGGALVGVQLGMPRGWLRPYAAAGVGTTHYYVLRVEDGACIPEDCTESTIRRSDFELTTGWSVGAHVPLGRIESTRIALHLAWIERDGGTPAVETLRNGAPPGPGPDVHYRSLEFGVSLLSR